MGEREGQQNKNSQEKKRGGVTLSTPEAGDRSREVRAGGRANDRRARCAPRGPTRPSRPRRPSRGGGVFLGGAGVGAMTSPTRAFTRRFRDEAVDRTSTVAFDLVFSFRFALTLLVFCRCVGRIVQSKLSVGFFSLFTVGLARPPARWFLPALASPRTPRCSSRRCSVRANLVSCDFYSLTCGISANLEAAKKSVSAFQCFSYTLFLFFFPAKQKANLFFQR